ncbi:tautomerase family protein [Mycolicibacterium sp. CBMA 226]|uniref:tautomerase family protein n=1 Tax=Mycolicibacterium sp. CBMA 226 TaxID=2606611 RepID=UPI0012DD0987|nr:tautomerase family protein [Mycolicibacterium sp. CBMA 226]MUL79008.1 4-oxalocrotonate tautomerase [Mycolicibacterium sp. CBMA 226]QGW61325.1 2-hydroxymuconate tautomerase [Mycolicibacterium sp.]
MPMIQVTLTKGRTPEQLRALAQALTAATQEALGDAPERIRVSLTECEPDLRFVGGESLADPGRSSSRWPTLQLNRTW